MSRTSASSFGTVYSKDVPQDVVTKKQYLSSWKLRIVITSLPFVVFLVALDVNIIGTAVPIIISKFDSLEDIGWYKTTYLLTLSALQIPLATIYKLFNIKTAYIASISLFETGSILCAASANSSALVAGRAIAGIGAAGILQGALAIIGQLADLTHVPLYFGIIGAFFGISAYMIPILGSLFTDHVTWRWCFWMHDSVNPLKKLRLTRIRNLPIAEVFGASILHLMKQGPQGCSIKLRVPTFGRKSLIFDPLLDAGTLEATAQKASATFFQHFVSSGISSNLSLSTGRTWAYQPINATLPSCLIWDDTGPVYSKPSVWPVSHTDRTADAQTWRRVSVLRMNAVAVWLSVGILAWLVATVVVVAAALRWHLRGLRGDVERVVDVLPMVAGSDRLLQLVNEGGERAAAKQGVMTRLGWFEDRDGSMRWGIEVVEDEGETRDN